LAPSKQQTAATIMMAQPRSRQEMTYKQVQSARRRRGQKGTDQQSPIGSRMTSAVVSIFTSAFTITTLYQISTQRELWIAIFLEVELLFLALQQVVAKCIYSREEVNDVDKVTIFRFTTILHMTVLFVLVKLATDIFSFLIATTVMRWFDYVNILTTVVFFIIVIFARLEF
jgi:hypothetical protein